MLFREDLLGQICQTSFSKTFILAISPTFYQIDCFQMSMVSSHEYTHYQRWHMLLSIIKLIPSAQQPPFNHIKGTPPNRRNRSQ